LNLGTPSWTSGRLGRETELVCNGEGEGADLDMLMTTDPSEEELVVLLALTRGVLGLVRLAELLLLGSILV